MYPENTDVPKKHQRNRRTPCFLGTSVFSGYIAILRIHRCSPVTLVFYMSMSVFSGYIAILRIHRCSPVTLVIFRYVSVLRIHRYTPDTSVFSGYVGVLYEYVSVPGEH
jgi:hypothetical protein